MHGNIEEEIETHGNTNKFAKEVASLELFAVAPPPKVPSREHWESHTMKQYSHLDQRV